MDNIRQVATELGDTLTPQMADGGHATVYFGEKFVYKVTEKKVMEKSHRIHAILDASNDTALKSFVPKTALFKDLGDTSLVVEERMQGVHPENVDERLIGQVHQVLQQVHEIDIKQILTNYEGDELPAADYWKNQVEQSNRFKSKLLESGTLTPGDVVLINDTAAVVTELCLSKLKPPKLVLVYKDVHPMNILVDDENGGLRAIVDWDSAMSGPVELEYAVLWHRYPALWQSIRPGRMDKDTFIVAGLVQGLRFWKSFANDSPYVQQQRNALQRTLDIHRSDEAEWMDAL